MPNNSLVVNADNLKLVLGVKRRLSRMNDASADTAEQNFENSRSIIIKRDKWVCKCCGARTVETETAKQGYFEIHHIDDNHHNNNPSNLALLCPLCHSTFTLGKRGDHFTSDLILYPYWTQEELNRFYHIALTIDYLARNNFIGKEHAHLQEYINSMFKVIRKESEALKSLNQYSVIREYLFNEDMLYSVLARMKHQEYQDRELLIRDMRLIPKIDKDGKSFFEKEIAYWVKNVWKISEDAKNGKKVSKGGISPATWDDLLAGILSLQAKLN